MAKKKKAKSENENELAFEDALARLEAIVRQLESPDVGLNEAMKQYEDGVKYLRACHKTLAAAETQIEMLTRIDADGNAKSRPFDEATEEDESLEDKQDRRADRRSAKGRELF